MKLLVLSALVAAVCVDSSGGEQAGVSKSDYLDFMEAAVNAYSDERLVSYQAEAERDGVAAFYRRRAFCNGREPLFGAACRRAAYAENVFN